MTSRFGRRPTSPPGDRAVGDQALADLARRQHGVVAVRQLRDIGLSPNAAVKRVETGRLHRVHTGVYAVGHPVLTLEGRWLAAVLACGGGAVLSHRSSAELLELRANNRYLIDVTSPAGAGRSRPGIDLHRSRTLHARDTTEIRGIPCTTVARTLLDLAEVVNRKALERAYKQAEILRVLDLRALQDVLGRAAGRRGAQPLREVVATDAAEPALTRSELEERFLALCSAAGLPAPRVNAWLEVDSSAIEVDFLWPAERLIVETDGYAFHGTRSAFEADRRRDQRLLLAGWRVMRFTWRQIVQAPEEVAAALSALLAREAETGRRQGPE